MKKKLKLKILAGFMLLVALLIVAGTVSIIEFIKLSKSVTALIEDNYKTIEAGKTMIEALERKDSGTLMLLLGEKEEGREIIRLGNSTFIKALEIAKNNITESEEDYHIKRIESLYRILNKKLEESIYDTHKLGDMNWYYSEIHQSFLNVKRAVDELISLNQNSMYAEATMLKEKSHRAIMPGIVAIIGALVFTLLLNFFISKYFISPLNNLSESIRNFHVNDVTIKSTIKTNDELKTIEVNINNLIEKILKSKLPQGSRPCVKK